MKIAAIFSATAMTLTAGSALANDYSATINVDPFNGTSGADNFITDRRAYIPGDTYNGAGGTDTLWVGGYNGNMSGIDYPALNFDYRTAKIQSMEILSFNYMLMEMPGNVIFNSSQFGAGLMPNNLAIYGAWGNQDITVNLVPGNSQFNASAWDFRTDRIAQGAIWGPYTDPDLGSVGGVDTIHINGSTGHNTIVGTSKDDIIAGDAGNDVIEAGRGKNTVNGGVGFDTASYAGASAGVTVNLALLSAQNTIGAGVDTLLQMENLRGSSFNDRLTGNAAANEIEGGPANDTINGAAGLDTASYEHAPSAVTVSLATAAAQNTLGAGVDTLLQMENLRGSAFNDMLYGNFLDNVIEGARGNDTINGGWGLDTASYEHAPSAVAVSLAIAAAQNTVGAGVDTLIQIENLRGSAFNDRLTGNAVANTIEGDLGNDVIDGGGGLDIASYEHAPATVRVNLSLVAAQNTGGAGVDTLTRIEGVIGSSFPDVLVGNGLDNFFEGGAGNDSINGAGGVDTASYEHAPAGVTVNLALTAPQNTVGAGVDTLVAIENVTGSAFGDTLTGNAAANMIIGGYGKDLMQGAGGADTFKFRAPGESVVGANRDIISGFTSGVDVVDLSVIDANSKVAGDQPFNFIGASAFTGTPAQLRFSGGVLAGDIDGNGAADFEIALPGVALLNPLTDLKR